MTKEGLEMLGLLMVLLLGSLGCIFGFWAWRSHKTWMYILAAGMLALAAVVSLIPGCDESHSFIMWIPEALLFAIYGCSKPQARKSR